MRGGEAGTVLGDVREFALAVLGFATGNQVFNAEGAVAFGCSAMND